MATVQMLICKKCYLHHGIRIGATRTVYTFDGRLFGHFCVKCAAAQAKKLEESEPFQARSVARMP
jgi:hypothetical protein